MIVSIAAWGQVKTFNVAVPGTLSQIIPDNEKSTITDVKITGKINGSDIVVIRNMAGRDKKGNPTDGILTRLDLSDANIVSGGGAYFDGMDGELFSEDNTIGSNMFDLCDKLTYINTPKSVLKIDAAAFSSCSAIEELVLHEGLQEMGEAAFVGCGFSEITIPEGVTALPNLLFYFCGNLTTVNLPKSLSEIGSEIFAECPMVKNINIAEGNTSFKIIDGVLYNANLDKLLYYPAAHEGTKFDVPTTIKEIANGAFANSSLQTVTLNEGLITIGAYAFDGSSITSVTFPSTIMNVGEFAFNNCQSLVEVSLNDNLVMLSENMFSQCKVLTTVKLPSNLEIMGVMSFSGCKALKSITLPETLTELGNGAFNNCSNLESIIIPESVSAFGTGIFYGCSALAECDLPDGITEIPAQMFAGCKSLKEIKIPETVKYLMHYAFQSSGLTKVSIPASVVSITEGVFSGCKELTEIRNYNPHPQPLGIVPVFLLVNHDIPLYVPFGSKSAYEAAEGWNEFTNIIEMDPEATGIDGATITGSDAVNDAEYFDLNGVRVGQDHKGITIIRTSNGTTRKVIKQ